MDYTVKLVVGVKNGYTYYDHAITPIEKTKLLRSIDEIKRPFASKEHVRLSTNGAQEASTYERYLTVCRAIARTQEGHRWSLCVHKVLEISVHYAQARVHRMTVPLCTASMSTPERADTDLRPL